MCERQYTCTILVKWKLKVRLKIVWKHFCNNFTPFCVCQISRRKRNCKYFRSTFETKLGSRIHEFNQIYLFHLIDYFLARNSFFLLLLLLLLLLLSWDLPTITRLNRAEGTIKMVIYFSHHLVQFGPSHLKKWSILGPSILIRQLRFSYCIVVHILNNNFRIEN